MPRQSLCTRYRTLRRPGTRRGRPPGFIVPRVLDLHRSIRHTSEDSHSIKRANHFSSYETTDPRPLFDGARAHPLGNSLDGQLCKAGLVLFSTSYNKWYHLREAPLYLRGCDMPSTETHLVPERIPKLYVATSGGRSIVKRPLRKPRQTMRLLSPLGGHPNVYYSRKVGYFLQVLDFEPMVLDGKGHRRPPSEFKELRFQSTRSMRSCMCCLNSSLFYWFITVFSDCRHVNKREITAFPVDIDDLTEAQSDAPELIISPAVHGGHSPDNSETRHYDIPDTTTLTVQCIFPKKASYSSTD